MTTTSPEPDELAAAGPLRFPDGFRWGTATAAFQIEGATDRDGRRDSIWDAFARRPGAVEGGDTGEPACQHYDRYAEDVALMGDLGLPTYRFSVSWARVRPDGGQPNPAGLAFYDRLVDELLGAGVDPWLTLYHWDLPQALEDAGGWTHRDTAHRFAEYAATVHQALGDRVPTWTTLNEPWCSALLGYAAGVHAPGRTEPEAAVAAVHHLLLAHGLGVQALRDAGAATVGLTLNLNEVAAATDSPDDLDVARRVDGLQNRVWLDPVLRGSYPDDVWSDLGSYGLASHVRPGDLEVIGAPIDVLGVNSYTSALVRAGDPAAAGPSPWVGAEHAEEVDRGLPRTAMGWEVDAPAFARLLQRVDADYGGTPIVVTENGSAWDDVVSPDGSVHDPDRVDYLHDHLAAVHTAITAGADVRGYLAWSLLDNFEWAYGYGKRFGLVRVDYETQERTVKSSGRYFAEVVRTGTLPPGD